MKKYIIICFIITFILVFIVAFVLKLQYNYFLKHGEKYIERELRKNKNIELIDLAMIDEEIWVTIKIKNKGYIEFMGIDLLSFYWTNSIYIGLFDNNFIKIAKKETIKNQEIINIQYFNLANNSVFNKKYHNINDVIRNYTEILKEIKNIPIYSIKEEFIDLKDWESISIKNYYKENNKEYKIFNDKEFTNILLLHKFDMMMTTTPSSPPQVRGGTHPVMSKKKSINLGQTVTIKLVLVRWY